MIDKARAKNLTDAENGGAPADAPSGREDLSGRDATAPDLCATAETLLEPLLAARPPLSAGDRARILQRATRDLPEEVLEAARAGDGGALVLTLRNRLVNLLAFYQMNPADYKNLVHRLRGAAFRHLHDSGRSEDAVQDTFLHMYRHRDSFRGDSSYSTWLHYILLSRLRLANRRQVLELPMDVLASNAAVRDNPGNLLQFLEDRPDTGPNGEEICASREKLCKVWAQAEVLLTDTHSYRALNLLFLQGLSYEEAAEVMGIKVEYLHKLVSWARARLRESSRIKAILEGRNE